MFSIHPGSFDAQQVPQKIEGERQHGMSNHGQELSAQYLYLSHPRGGTIAIFHWRVGEMLGDALLGMCAPYLRRGRFKNRAGRNSTDKKERKGNSTACTGAFKILRGPS